MINYNENYSIVRLTSTGSVRTGEGQVGGFIVASGTPTIALYDGTSTAGALLLNTMQTVVATPYPFPVGYRTGLFAVITGTADVTFFIN